MNITSKRYSAMVDKLRSQLIQAVKGENTSQAERILARMNKVFSIQRDRNISNGLSAPRWNNLQLELVKADMYKKGLIK